MIVCVFEDNEQYVLEALEGTQRLWRESVDRAALEPWLKQTYESGRLQRQQVMFLVLPEPLLVRRVLALPAVSKAYQLRGMAANALLPLLNERAAALRAVPGADGSGCVVCGCKKSVLTQHLTAFGRYRRKVKVVGVADYRVAQQPALADGCYTLQEDMWTAVIAVQNGRIVDGRAEYGGSSFGLWQELAEAHREEAIFFAQPQPLPVQPEGVPEEAALRHAALSSNALEVPTSLSKDRVLAALLVSCVLLPSLLLLASTLRPAETDETQAETAVAAVARSDYHTLLTQAYAVKSERITLLNHEAGDNTLAINGRCSEALDLADYMRQLAAAEPSLHPLLLDMTRKSEDKAHHYEFTVQISLEGSGAS